MKQIIVVRSLSGKCREHWLRTRAKWPFFTSIDNALAFLKREKLDQAVVAGDKDFRDLGRESQFVALGYIVTVESAP
jgi:hypothetical protein